VTGEKLLTRATEALAAKLHAYGTGPEVFGLLHADLRLANLMGDGDRLTAIDLDDCGFGWWAYDLASALSFIETDPRLPDLIARWCDGYTRIAPLRPEDRSVRARCQNRRLPKEKSTPTPSDAWNTRTR